MTTSVRTDFPETYLTFVQGGQFEIKPVGPREPSPQVIPVRQVWNLRYLKMRNANKMKIFFVTAVHRFQSMYSPPQ